jgi:hypothetical protein
MRTQGLRQLKLWVDLSLSTMEVRRRPAELRLSDPFPEPRSRCLPPLLAPRLRRGAEGRRDTKVTEMGLLRRESDTTRLAGASGRWSQEQRPPHVRHLQL